VVIAVYLAACLLLLLLHLLKDQLNFLLALLEPPDFTSEQLKAFVNFAFEVRQDPLFGVVGGLECAADVTHLLLFCPSQRIFAHSDHFFLPLNQDLRLLSFSF